MNTLNSILFEGLVVRQPELTVIESGTKFCAFKVEGFRNYLKDGKEEKESTFLTIETYGHLAIHCAAGCVTGRYVRAVGRIKQNTFTDETGRTQSEVVIDAEHIEFRSKAYLNQSEKDAQVI